MLLMQITATATVFWPGPSFQLFGSVHQVSPGFLICYYFNLFCSMYSSLKFFAVLENSYVQYLEIQLIILIKTGNQIADTVYSSSKFGTSLIRFFFCLLHIIFSYLLFANCWLFTTDFTIARSASMKLKEILLTLVKILLCNRGM